MTGLVKEKLPFTPSDSGNNAPGLGIVQFSEIWPLEIIAKTGSLSTELLDFHKNYGYEAYRGTDETLPAPSRMVALAGVLCETTGDTAALKHGHVTWLPEHKDVFSLQNLIASFEESPPHLEGAPDSVLQGFAANALHKATRTSYIFEQGRKKVANQRLLGGLVMADNGNVAGTFYSHSYITDVKRALSSFRNVRDSVFTSSTKPSKDVLVMESYIPRDDSVAYLRFAVTVAQHAIVQSLKCAEIL